MTATTTPKLKTTATTATATDPLAGIPLATAKPAPAVAAPAASVPTGPLPANVINLARAKKKRHTGAEYKAARAFAEKATGYDATSPIRSKRLIEVLVSIETALVEALDDLSKTPPAPATAASGLRGALELNRELQKRLATNAVIAAQLK